jgi:hypothetical protein
MTVNTALALGNTAAVSSNIVIPSGASYSVGMFAGAGEVIPGGLEFSVSIVTPGSDTLLGVLTSTSDGLPAVSVAGPGTFRVSRPAFAGAPVGVFFDDGI